MRAVAPRASVWPILTHLVKLLTPILLQHELMGDNDFAAHSIASIIAIMLSVRDECPTFA